ncbi:hypothetical protein GV829_04700 [Sphingomonas lacunae]|uniref:Lipoprotein n=1 Tax=Sphingomonas lacunae TaxID=2698828 RepID=A0A6M4AS02_9SPHN|nr:hypothetical protein [Sphingomonas lacunae]QJQ31835.1 hypothetical protein GV829_04700 [Sphingomonas lacunae]
MSSNRRRALMRLWILPCLALPVAACVGTPPIVASPSACSSLLPPEWQAGVEGAPLPAGETIGEWISYADAQTGQLDKANDRYVAATGIISRCEERDRQAIERNRRRWWQIL